MALPARLASVLSDPPRAYSPALIWWWSGEPLDPARLRWQLERFAEGGVYQLVVLNLAPAGSDHGCDADDPPFFSERWWEIFLGVCDDAAALGISLWFYDQLGFSGADIQARLVARQPAFAGRRLQRQTVSGTGRLSVRCPAGGRVISAAVEPVAEVVMDGAGASCEATVPSELSLFYETDHGFDYLSPAACTALLDQVHGEFERRLGDRLGAVVVGSFQDELPSVPTWSADFAERFEARYGYDLRDRLSALWDTGVPDGARVRRNYHALRASLAEEAFFRPLHAWHEKHGLIVGCDQQDPARAGLPVDGVELYADYARTHRWFSAPGSDHHGDARIHSSLAHLYGRPRTWIEAFHSTGWGGTLEETFDWLLPWLRTGATLYNPHAVYYTTRAGWWEWAPPSTDWRQPYWRHHKYFADAVTRLCASLSLGRHVCEVAVLFPNATAQADLTLLGPGPEGSRAQEVYRELVGDATWFAPVPGVLDRARIDADVIDDDSLAAASVVAGPRLSVASESYAAIVLPAATALESAVASRLADFIAAGGVVVAVGVAPVGLPGAVVVDSSSAVPAALAGVERRVEADVPVLTREVDDALVVFVTPTEWSATVIDGEPVGRGISHEWARVGYSFDPSRYRDEVRLRVRDAPGPPVLVSPFDGSEKPLAFEDGEVVVPFDHGPAALVVFAQGNENVNELAERRQIVDNLTGDWDVELIPTLDNTWGDFAWPAADPGADVVVERWALEHRVDGSDAWRPAHATFGPHGLIDGEVFEYSDSRGIRKDHIHQHALGPKGHVPEDFLDFGSVGAGQTVTFTAAFSLETALSSTVVVGAPAAKELLIDGESLPIADDGGYFGSVPVTLAAGTHHLELRLTPSERLELRANVAFVRDLASYRRPEWIAVASAGSGTAIRYTTTVVPGDQAELTLTAWGSARLYVNNVEVGRQGGFMPYERSTPRVRRYDAAAALRPDVENTIVVEVTRPTPILVDGLVISDHDWKATVDGATVPTFRRRPWHRAMADLYLTRRPHPLPAAAWLDGTDTTVVESVTFAVPRPAPERIEHLRFDLPPGTTHLELALTAEAVLTVDGQQLAIGSGMLTADVPAGARTGYLTVMTTPGHEVGAALTDPIRATVGPGRIPLGDWETLGLSEYSGGVRYIRRLHLPAADHRLLDLGRVRGTAEVLVDGTSIGTRFCSPYTYDLSALAAGDHHLTVEVFNTAAPHLDATSPTHFVFPGQKTSGLLGPVTLEASGGQ
ncbi:hypothetical protein E1218_14985 [Kribbella turkmenica]|uniref:Glycoside hydrolase family 2 sugar binding protein n=1 Tax=Kribbella turkmenica TaxID=2530375 RepID=A0A4R4X561_9ACTN|nr:hypothetical protein [Kribbella turkmenica]TDD25395.1 hypothetical protein E1218_14985 [Kribbella turkmenica]